MAETRFVTDGRCDFDMPPKVPSGGRKNKCAEYLRNHLEESAHLFFVALIDEYTKFLNQK